MRAPCLDLKLAHFVYGKGYTIFPIQNQNTCRLFFITFQRATICYQRCVCIMRLGCVNKIFHVFPELDFYTERIPTYKGFRIVRWSNGCTIQAQRVLYLPFS